MREFGIKTNDRQKKILDLKISEFFYASNILFNVTDSKAFIEMINALQLAGWLLDEANKKVLLLVEEELKTAVITFFLDGYSNTSADPFIVASTHTSKGNIY